MKQFLKHTGVLNPTSQRVIVIMRKLPDEPTNALVVEHDRLPDMYRDNLITMLKSEDSSKTNDFYTVIENRSFGDNQPILSTLHMKGYIKKVATKDVTLKLPDNQVLGLADFNSYMDGIEVPEAETINEVMMDKGPVLKGKKLAVQLLAEAKELDKQADAKKEKAYVLCPDLRPSRGRPKQSIDEKRAKRMNHNRIRRERYAAAKASEA